MADNVEITAGTGTTIATDEVTDGTLGTVQVQFMKLMDGTLNSTNKLTVNSSGQALVLASTSADSTVSPGTAPSNSRLAGGIFNTTQPTFTNGQAGAVQLTSRGAQIVSTGVDTFNVTVNAALPAGSATIGAVNVNGTVPVSGTFWQATQPVSIASLPALASGSNIIGNVRVDQTTPGTTNGVALTHVGSTAVVTGGVNGSQGVGGLAAQGASVSGNPVLNGGRAATANPTAVTNGQASSLMTDKVGRQVVVQGHTRDLVAAQATTITSSTSPTTVVTAAGSGVFADITSLTVTNGSATATAVTLSDGTNSFIYNCSGGGGLTVQFNPPLPATTANTAWTLACGTSVASVYCNIVYVKNI